MWPKLKSRFPAPQNLMVPEHCRWGQDTSWPNVKPQTTHSYTWDSTVIADTSGNKNTLTAYNDPNLEENPANCKSGRCIYLDGGAKQYLAAPEFSFGAYPGLSFSAWFKDVGGGSWPRIIDFNNGDPLDNILVTRSSLSASAGKSMLFEVGRSTPPINTPLVPCCCTPYTPDFRSPNLNPWSLTLPSRKKNQPPALDRWDAGGLLTPNCTGPAHMFIPHVAKMAKTLDPVS